MQRILSALLKPQPSKERKRKTRQSAKKQNIIYQLNEARNTENDEVDGSVISRYRRRRGVKVTGRYIPPLEWEKVNASHSVSSLNNSYFEKVYDDLENYFQASDMSTKLLLKNDGQGSTQTNHRGDNTHKTEQEKQRREPVASTQAFGNMPQEKINDKKTDDKNETEKSDEDVLPCGSAIPKETLEELKLFLKESPLIHHRNKQNPKINTTVTHIHLPKRVEKIREKPGLTFETFRPHMEKDIQKQQTANIFEVKQKDEMLIDPMLPDPAGSQKDEKIIQPIQTFNENQILIPDQLSIAAGSTFEPPETEFKDYLPASSKDADPSGDGTEDSVSLIILVERIKQQIAREDIRFVRFEATDLHGVSRSKTIPARFFQDKALNGVCMPRSYLELTLDHKGNEVDHISSKQFNCDILLKPDLQTFQVLPWHEKTARVICDSFTFLGNPLLTSPRYLAKHLLNQLQERGFLLHSAFKYEFCLFGLAEIINSKTISFPAATLLSDHQMFMQEFLEGMYYIGGNIESFSPSIFPGQMEVSFVPEYGLAAADNAFTFKTSIKEAAKKQDYVASFYTDSVGFYNSGVLSHSLWDISGAKNVFHTGSHEEVLTDIGKQWLSGLLHHSAALSCLVAPGAVSRKRFLKDDKNPHSSICTTWGSNNNNFTYNFKSHGCNGTYIENMLCSATANPYLVLAATVAAGLDGIRRGLDLLKVTNNHTSLTEQKTPSIPLKLEDALTALEEDTYMTASLGEPFIRYFIAMKRYELETEEGDTERNKFLEYFI
ncbi:lengsin isoform X3 [Aquarana catesbeiana]|uniref:lengsin isoform X3 n=1 Tax=Aquarana catesbeiana TaxID=8400 RepID=UPI003CC9A6BF